MTKKEKTMKARIRKTGEIVNLAGFATITLEACDSYGNPIELKPEEVELIDDIKEDKFLKTDWNQVRIKAAIAAMQGFISNPNSDMYDWETAKCAVKHADALVEELKKEQK